MNNRSFVFDLKYGQIVEMLESLGFVVCDDKWNKKVEENVNNESTEVSYTAFMVKLGNANVKVPQGINKEDPFKLLVTKYYLKPIWSGKLITTDWGRLNHAIYGEEYDKFYIKHYEETRQQILQEIRACQRCNFEEGVEKNKKKLQNIENIIDEYNEFLSQDTTTPHRESEGLCK